MDNCISVCSWLGALVLATFSRTIYQNLFFRRVGNSRGGKWALCYFAFHISYLDSIVMIIKELASSECIHNGVIMVFDNVVSGNGWQIGSSLSENAPFELHQVVLRQKICGIRYGAS